MSFGNSWGGGLLPGIAFPVLSHLPWWIMFLSLNNFLSFLLFILVLQGISPPPPSHNTEQSDPTITLLFMASPADITLQGNNSPKKYVSPLKKNSLFIFQAALLCSLSCVLFLLHSSTDAMENSNKWHKPAFYLQRRKSSFSFMAFYFEIFCTVLVTLKSPKKLTKIMILVVCISDSTNWIKTKIETCKISADWYQNEVRLGHAIFHPNVPTFSTRWRRYPCLNLGSRQEINGRISTRDYL